MRYDRYSHDHYSIEDLAAILGDIHSVAIVGASVRDDRPSHWVTGFLLGKGYTVFPVNPRHAGLTVLGCPVRASLSDLDQPVDLIDVFRRADAFGDVVDEVLRLDWRPKAIWGQLGVRDDEAARRAEDAGIRVVMNRALVAEYGMIYGLTHGHGREKEVTGSKVRVADGVA
ncbi:CoA-binding protein [Rhizobium halophytocola]|uniref:CoA-binding protein n=1 Tax=Rhizobium halophytocola TaxID=735519 RepID=A0ABS4DY89_9HYPH|nr:CoA-binding protein [Rhizobium halophytocola]MBP1850652.1 putative CoA-binding protein [Rhizobium halophytocola]